MSDDDHEFEQLRRRLADEGQAQAPDDLAGEVMRRVRAEPRRRQRRSLQPVLVPLVAALLAAAGLVGVSHLGGSASSSSAGSTAAGGGKEQAGSVAAPAAHPPGSGQVPLGPLVVRGVALDKAGAVFGVATRCPVGDRLSVTVPDARYNSVATRLQALAAQPAAAGSRQVDVRLRHAPKAQTQIRITCP
jgi:hypothetical protein